MLMGAKTDPGLDVELISIGLDGRSGGGDYYNSSEIRTGAVSADGRYVAFSSLADTLTAEETDSGWHVYVRDREDGNTSILTFTGPGVWGSSMEGQAVISADGRYVAFRSSSAALVANDTNGVTDIFVYDRDQGSIKRVSVASDGTQSTGCSCGWPDTCNGCEYHWVNSNPSISADGRYIAFTSFSYNFVDGDLPDTPDVFVHDQVTGTTTLVSRSSDGNIGNGNSGEPAISADGDSIAFSSKADNLVAGDTNGVQDVFVWCRDEGSVALVSVATDGTQGNYGSYDPDINEDGSLIAFHSSATNLDGSDSNGTSFDVFLRDRGYGTTTKVDTRATSASKPVLSDDGEYLSFTSGTREIFLVRLEDGFSQRISAPDMFDSALDESGNTLVVSGYASLLPDIDDGDKDVYAYILGGDMPAPDEDCTDGIDNDGDGLIDCDDSVDCGDDPACTEPPPDSEICDDGVDNDGDGQIDCNDSDCGDDPVCDEPPSDPEICDDGIDNDGDGLTDCADRLDCRQDPACKTGGGGGGGKNR